MIHSLTKDVKRRLLSACILPSFSPSSWMDVFLPFLSISSTSISHALSPKLTHLFACASHALSLFPSVSLSIYRYTVGILLCVLCTVSLYIGLWGSVTILYVQRQPLVTYISGLTRNLIYRERYVSTMLLYGV